MRWFFTTLIILLATSAAAEDWLMNCKVTHQSITRFENDRVRAYSGYEDKLKVGDSLGLRFFSTDRYPLWFELTDKKRNHLYFIGMYEKTTHKSKLTNGLTHMLFESDHVTTASIDEDELVLNWGYQTLSMRRYFKSDYVGMLVVHEPRELTSEVMTFDCKTMIDNWDSFFSAFD